MNAVPDKAIAAPFRSAIEASASRRTAEPYSIFEPGHDVDDGPVAQLTVDARDAGNFSSIAIDSG